jgi:hypothetical protein
MRKSATPYPIADSKTVRISSIDITPIGITAIGVESTIRQRSW